MEDSFCDLSGFEHLDYCEMSQLEVMFKDLSDSPVVKIQKHDDNGDQLFQQLQQSPAHIGYSPLSSTVEDTTIFDFATTGFQVPWSSTLDVTTTDPMSCSLVHGPPPPAACRRNPDAVMSTVDAKPQSRRGRKPLPVTGGTREEVRKQKRRDSNRRAAEKYRQKQKASVDDFKSEHERLIAVNGQLTAEVERLRNIIAYHNAHSGCTVPLNSDGPDGLMFAPSPAFTAVLHRK